jgi:heptosyltransferase I
MTQLLIILPSSLGDIVHGLQVASSIKEQRPEVRISWIVREIFAPLVRSCEAVDHTYVFRRDGGIGGFLRLMREVRQTEFDYVFDMQGLLRTGLMTLRTIAPRKIGRTDSRECSGFFYSERVALPAAGRRSHSLEKLLQFAAVVGAKPELRGTLRFRDTSGINLNHVSGPGGNRPILMFPNSRRSDKRWTGFKQLTELILREDRRRRVVWAGTNYVPDKDAFLPDQFLNLTGNTSVVALPALMQRALWVITNESGPMHLAAAMGLPLLAIFGASDPLVAGPYPPRGPTNHVIQAPVGDLKLLSAKEVFARFRRVSGQVLTSSPFPA